MKKKFKMFIFKHTGVLHSILVTWLKKTSKIHTLDRWVQKAYIYIHIYIYIYTNQANIYLSKLRLKKISIVYL